MTVIETTREETSFTIVADFDAPVERVWQLWADPRKLERWWGPPGFPATFRRHDFTVPGISLYAMPTDGGLPGLVAWRFVSIDAPTSLEVENGFADEVGEPVGDIPWSRVIVRLEPTESGTRQHITTEFGSAGALERMLSYGIVEGMTAALSQTDDILQED
jgi:uncharacterized protein YndB with AHSA1/START domain